MYRCIFGHCSPAAPISHSARFSPKILKLKMPYSHLNVILFHLIHPLTHRRGRYALESGQRILELSPSCHWWSLDFPQSRCYVVQINEFVKDNLGFSCFKLESILLKLWLKCLFASACSHAGRSTQQKSASSSGTCPAALATAHQPQ